MSPVLKCPYCIMISLQNKAMLGAKGGRFLWPCVIAMVFTVGLFWIGFECQIDRLYASSPYHRLQVEALLDGRFSLSSSIEEIDHGLAWYNGRINQVWGL